MSLIILFIATYAAAVLQTALVPAFEIRHVMPDLFALVTVLWLVAATTPRAFVAVAMVGLACDLTSGGPLGVGFAAFALVGFSIGQAKKRVDTNHFAVRIAIIFVATAVIALVEAFAARLAGDPALTWTTLTVRAICVAAYTAGVALPVLMVVGWLPRRRIDARDLPLTG